MVLSVTILETTKTQWPFTHHKPWFYRSQFWRLQKLAPANVSVSNSFIGHNFGDYKNRLRLLFRQKEVLSVTILETTKTGFKASVTISEFYRSQFWRLQKPNNWIVCDDNCFIGHNFGDYKNLKWYQLITP